MTIQSGENNNIITVNNNKNQASINGSGDCVGGISGKCTAHVAADATVWNTNTFNGIVTATGTNKGDYYGYIS